MKCWTNILTHLYFLHVILDYQTACPPRWLAESFLWSLHWSRETYYRYYLEKVIPCSIRTTWSLFQFFPASVLHKEPYKRSVIITLTSLQQNSKKPLDFTRPVSRSSNAICPGPSDKTPQCNSHCSKDNSSPAFQQQSWTCDNTTHAAIGQSYTYQIVYRSTCRWWLVSHALRVTGIFGRRVWMPTCRTGLWTIVVRVLMRFNRWLCFCRRQKHKDSDSWNKMVTN